MQSSGHIVKNLMRRFSSSDCLFTPLTINSEQNCGPMKVIDKYSSPQHKRLLLVSPFNNPIFCKMSNNTPSTSYPSDSQEHRNRLSLEKSPYLLQHATNPVDWYPWCKEAFDKARRENKLIFLSVGYSTCHWCHVMEKESFENAVVAEIMNKYYINIKVDREERPDIDRVYMSFIQATSGGGGWPMSVFLTPNLEPITGGTYFPPEDRWGRPGFKTILKNIADRWANEKETVIQSGKHILEILKRACETNSGNFDTPGPECVSKCFQQFNKSFDVEYGGFSKSPKFPQPSNFNFLFHLYSRDPNSKVGEKCLNMCLHTLKCMALGGIHDHISSGFARYSTDSKWHVPHFEKMLYDQAQLAISYCNAYLASKDEFYAAIVRDILLYVSRDLSHEFGGFYSAEDADSLPTSNSNLKKEGAFCVWEYDEILKNLKDRTGNIADSEIFCYHFNVRKNGNVPSSQDPHNELSNKNVLIVFGSIENTAEFFELTPEQIKHSLEKSIKILYQIRQKRPRPHLDSKILTAWNGLMISGFAKAGEILKNDNYTKRAVQAANFVRKYLYIQEEKVLLRCCYRGDEGQIIQNQTPIVGFLDDYAFFIRCLIDLYENTLDASWLEWAEILQDTQDRLFWDEINSGYFGSPTGDISVLIRVKDDQDGAEPSGNSVSAYNLIKLSAYLDRPAWKNQAEKLLQSFGERLEKIPMALPEMMSALMLLHDSLTNVLIVGDRNDPSTQALLNAVRSRIMPGRSLVLADGLEGLSGPLYDRLDILKKLKMQCNKPTAYVCHHHSCSLPVNGENDLIVLLDNDLVQGTR